MNEVTKEEFNEEINKAIEMLKNLDWKHGHFLVAVGDHKNVKCVSAGCDQWNIEVCKQEIIAAQLRIRQN